MLRFGALLLAGGVACGVAAACSSFSSNPGPAADASVDAVLTEAGTQAPVDDAAVAATDAAVASCPPPFAPAPTDLLDEDFALSGCNAWIPINATLQSVTTECGRACRVCVTDPTQVSNAYHVADFDAGSGSFELTGWMRSDDAEDAGVGPAATYKVDTIFFDGTSYPVAPSAVGGFPAAPSWKKVEQTQALTTQVRQATIFFNGQTLARNGCFLVTNVRLTRSP